jgi:hypothetical protein
LQGVGGERELQASLQATTATAIRGQGQGAWKSAQVAVSPVLGWRASRRDEQWPRAGGAGRCALDGVLGSRRARAHMSQRKRWDTSVFNCSPSDPPLRPGLRPDEQDC